MNNVSSGQLSPLSAGQQQSSTRGQQAPQHFLDTGGSATRENPQPTNFLEWLASQDSKNMSFSTSSRNGSITQPGSRPQVNVSVYDTRQSEAASASNTYSNLFFALPASQSLPGASANSGLSGAAQVSQDTGSAGVSHQFLMPSLLMENHALPPIQSADFTADSAASNAVVGPGGASHVVSSSVCPMVIYYYVIFSPNVTFYNRVQSTLCLLVQAIHELLVLKQLKKGNPGALHIQSSSNTCYLRQTTQ